VDNLSLIQGKFVNRSFFLFIRDLFINLENNKEKENNISEKDESESN
jgi:hypothetical protein